MTTTRTTPTAAAPTTASTDAAVTAFAEVLGAEAVETDPAALREFRDPYVWTGSGGPGAAAAVFPTTTEQVRAVVRIAAERRVPLWTVSQGRNYAYGGAAPRVPGSVVVNLRRMNRVLEVDEDLCYAVLEPGARFFDLYEALQQAGGRCWPATPDLGWGSVVGNALEYGRGPSPYGDHADNLCGLEAVLGDGDVLRTGMGGQDGNRAWHVYRHSYGPSLDRLFMQSNFGIVTRAGVWLMRRPEVYAVCTVTWTGDDALEQAVEVLRELLATGAVQSKPTLGRGVRMPADGPPQIDPDDPTWRLTFALYGHEGVVAANRAVCERAFAAVPGTTMSCDPRAGTDEDTPSTHEHAVHRGIPQMTLLHFFQSVFGPNTGHLDFSPVGPLSGPDVAATQRLLRELCGRRRLPHVLMMIIQPRNVIHLTTTLFDTDDEAATREAYDGYAEMVGELTRAGKALYRANIYNMDAVADQFDFNDHVQRRVNSRLKAALDPAGILSPGKQGIWPPGADDPRLPAPPD